MSLDPFDVYQRSIIILRQVLQVLCLFIVCYLWLINSNECLIERLHRVSLNLLLLLLYWFIDVFDVRQQLLAHVVNIVNYFAQLCLLNV